MKELNKEDVENLSFTELRALLLIVNNNREIVKEQYETYFKYIYCYLPNGNSDKVSLIDYLNELFPKRFSVDWKGQLGFVGTTTVKVFKKDFDSIREKLIEKYSEEVFKN